MFHKKIKVPLFNSTLNFVIVNNDYEFKYLYAAENRFCDLVDEDYETQRTNLGFFHCIKADGIDIDTICINYHYVKEDDSSIYDTISHEVFHYVFHLFNDIIGIPCKRASEETYAYTIGYIMGEICKLMKEFEEEQLKHTDDIDYIFDNYKELSVYELINKLMFIALDGPYLASTMLSKLSEGVEIDIIKEEIIEIFIDNAK